MSFRTSSATITDFSGAMLEVHLVEGATLEGQNLGYDLMTANKRDEAVLLMEDVRPLPVADINLSDQSSATINIMDGSFITGAARGESSLSYYGDNIIVLLNTDATSLVTRLGPTRQ